MSRAQRKKEAAKKRASELRQQGPPPPAKQAKGKGKGKTDHNAKLDGKCKQTTSGEPICFNFNLRGCPNAAAGAKCPRGWHLCAELGCQKPHPLSEHRS